MSRLVLLLLLVTPALPALAHEFWIEPYTYQVPKGGTLLGEFKNGQQFNGSSLAYFDRRSAGFAMISDGKRQELTPRSGDAPALNAVAPEGAGLVVVVHETTPSTLIYSEWEKFVAFTEHKDFKTAVKDHLAAGFAQQNFKESYTRHIKTLIAVADGAGSDSITGLETEFVALTNPYTDDFDDQMRVNLYYQGALRPDAQIEVFDRDPAGDVTITLHRTDAQGAAVIPVTSGHRYLFDAVVLRPAPDAGSTPDAAVWETLWAALTFGVP